MSREFTRPRYLEDAHRKQLNKARQSLKLWKIRIVISVLGIIVLAFTSAFGLLEPDMFPTVSGLGIPLAVLVIFSFPVHGVPGASYADLIQLVEYYGDRQPETTEPDTASELVDVLSRKP